MFGIGFGEFAIIFVVLIVAVGPDKLPTLMKTVGKTIRGLRQASRDIRSAVGIDEMMREDFSPNTPPARRPKAPPVKPLSREAGSGDAASADRADNPIGQANAVPWQPPPDGAGADASSAPSTAATPEPAPDAAAKGPSKADASSTASTSGTPELAPDAAKGPSKADPGDS